MTITIEHAIACNLRKRCLVYSINIMLCVTVIVFASKKNKNIIYPLETYTNYIVERE